MPEISDEEITAAHTVMKTIEKLHEYAQDHPRDALDEERLAVLHSYVQGFHSTLSMIYAAQEDN